MTEPCNINVEAKQNRAAMVAAEREREKQRRRCERKCFWTRPLGHWYERKDSGIYTSVSQCVGCGRVISRSYA